MTYTWSVPAGDAITGSTRIKDTDNKIGNTIDDLVDFVNGEGGHAGQGLTYDLVDKLTAQTISGVKTFTGNIVASGGVTGNVTGSSGSCTGNSATATTLSAGADRTKLDGIEAGANLFVMPAGVVVMWSGLVTNIPSGWYLCDGTNGTPNLTDRFVVGAGSGYTGGNTGGSSSVTPSGSISGTVGGTALTEAQMPKHYHQMRGPNNISAPQNNQGTGGQGNYGGGTPDDAAQSYGTWSTGGGAASGSASTGTGNGQSHNHSFSGSFTGSSQENRPPYYAILFIMKG